MTSRMAGVLVITAAVVFAPAEALACPVCFGATDSPMASAMNWAILTLLGIVGAVLGGIVTFFVHLAKQARLAREREAEWADPPALTGGTGWKPSGAGREA
jgi:hypothetical protein